MQLSLHCCHFATRGLWLAAKREYGATIDSNYVGATQRLTDNSTHCHEYACVVLLGRAASVGKIDRALL